MQMVCAARYSGFFLCLGLPADQPDVVCTPTKAQNVLETIAQNTHVEDVRTHGAALLGSEICRQLPHDCLILVVRKFAGIHVGWYTALLKQEAVQNCIGNEHTVEEFREQ